MDLLSNTSLNYICILHYLHYIHSSKPTALFSVIIQFIIWHFYIEYLIKLLHSFFYCFFFQYALYINSEVLCCLWLLKSQHLH